MRATFTRMMTATMIAGAALLVSACGKTETAGSGDTNATDMSANLGDMSEGTTNDVTAMDATAGSDANMAMDSGAMAGDNATAGNASNAM